jgi:hypothetical protein
MTDHPPIAPLEDLLDAVYAGQERLSRGEIHRYATAAELPADQLARVDVLPEGEYTLDEAIEALNQVPELIPETGQDDAA